MDGRDPVSRQRAALIGRDRNDGHLTKLPEQGRKVGKIEAAVESCHRLMREASRERKMEAVIMEVQYVELVRSSDDGVELQKIIGHGITHIREPQRPWATGNEFRPRA